MVDRAGSLMTKRMLPWVLVVPPVLAFLRWLEEFERLFSLETGVVLITASSMIGLTAVVVLSARRLNRMEAPHHLASERLAAIVESSSDAISSTTLDGTVLTWNRAAERTYGYSAEEIIGRSIDIVNPPESKEEVSEVRARPCCPCRRCERPRERSWEPQRSQTTSPRARRHPNY